MHAGMMTLESLSSQGRQTALGITQLHQLLVYVLVALGRGAPPRSAVAYSSENCAAQLERLKMTLRERLHRQIDQLDAHQLAAIDMLLAQLTRPHKLSAAASPVSVPPYMRAQRMMAGHRGFAQDIIDARADRV
jgi:hypothetical protein